MSKLKIVLLVLLVLVVLLTGFLVFAAHKPKPEAIVYGMSFNTPYARELGLDWQETYDAIIDDLGVRHLRLAAHWPMVEPEEGVYNFTELDYQLARANEVGAEVIMSVGRRLPRWPECHIPNWIKSEDRATQNRALLNTLSIVVERYKNNPAIVAWQVENEPYLKVFAYEHCGDFDEDFFQSEIDLVRRLDGDRQILVTDSGNLGTWSGAYQKGDMFGTSVYVHFWNPELGQFRTLLPAWFYRLKDNYMRFLYGDKETVLIELSAEPWLLNPITETPLDVQYSRMNIEKFEDILQYAAKTRYEKQYLWGAEWWYWLHLRGESHMWERGLELFEATSNQTESSNGDIAESTLPELDFEDESLPVAEVEEAETGALVDERVKEVQ